MMLLLIFFLREEACCFSVTNNFLFFSIFLLVSRASSLCHAFGDVHWYIGVPGSVTDCFYTILVSKVIFI